MLGSPLLRKAFAPDFAWKHALISFALLLVVSGFAAAAVPTDPSARAKLVGQPLGLLVQPDSVTLRGARAVQQIVVSGRYADGTVRDLTPFCELTIENPLAEISGSGLV